MTDRFHLQPANAQPYERAISEVMDRAPELGPAITELRGFKLDPSDAILPYLIIEYGLTEIADYLPDMRVALTDGILWQRARGTPSAMHRALSWIGCDGNIEEIPATRFKWWWFQVHLDAEQRSSAFSERMTAVARASKPLRSEFARVTAGFDKRGFVLNASRLNGGALLNSWSGVRKRTDGPVLSLRVHEAVVSAVHPDGVGIQERSRMRKVYQHDTGPSTVTRSSMSVSGATDSVTWLKHVPFQHAPFTSGPFEEPTPLVQKGY